MVNLYKIFLLVATACILALCFISCQHPQDERGIPIIVRKTYFNYYLRGLAYALVEEWNKAAYDFEVALGVRKGAIFPEFHEKSQAKTYGVHFLDDYYPHRELGICYYFLQRFDDAERELSLSLTMLPSSRARFYLDKVQGQKFMLLPDRVPNPIKFDMDLTPGILYTNRPKLLLQGTISSPYHIKRVKINQKQEYIELAKETYYLDKQVSLLPGKQKVTVDAVDLVANSTRWEQDIIVDLQGPAVSFSPLASDPQNNIVIHISDNHQLWSVTIDGKNIKLPDEQKTYEETVPVKPHRNIDIKAIDRAGNQTTFKQNTADLLKASLNNLKHYPDNRRARAEMNRRSIEELNHDKQWQDLGIKSDFQYHVAQGGGLQSKQDDTMPPRIQLRPNIDKFTTVTTDLFTLDLSAFDRGFLDSISFELNGQREKIVLREHKFIEHRFTQILELRKGLNNLAIKVTDWAGNIREKTIRIKRKVPYNLRRDFRMTVSIHSLRRGVEESVESFNQRYRQVPDIKLGPWFNRALKKVLGNKISRLPEINMDPLLESIIWESERFNLVERDPNVVQRLFMEEELKASPLTDLRLAINKGQLRPAEWLLKIEISPLRGGTENLILVATVIDVSTGNIILSSKIDSGVSEDDIQFALQGLINKLVQQLPLLDTEIETVTNKRVTIPFGEQENIRPGYRFLLFSANEKDDDFAEPLTFNNRWIQGRVLDVKDSDSSLEIFPQTLPPEALELINPNDRVIMR